MIQTIGLTKHFRQGDDLVRALDGINLTIADGEFVSVTGRSGSGKVEIGRASCRERV